MKRILIFVWLTAAAAVSAQTNRTLSLNGQWKAAVAESCPQAFPYTVPVPGIMSQASPDPGIDFDANELKDDVGYNYVWYTTEFDLSTSQDGYDNGNYTHALLRLRAKYNAQVILNGEVISYDPHCCYSHGEFDVSHALRFDGPNRLIVRVGSWNTASYPSRENEAEWWRTSRAPGICDDVTLQLTHDVTIRHLKILPEPSQQQLLCTVRLSNFGTSPQTVRGRITIDDCRFDADNDFDEVPVITTFECGELQLPADSTCEYTFRIPASGLKPWTPGREGDPQLYRANFILAGDRAQACKTETFGYRDIRVQGRDVLVNGRKVLFRAENIAFHRALTRWADEVFDEAWIRQFLRSAVEEYGFNYLRMHLGHAYGKWYDIADEMGLMIQDEWRFMHDDEPHGADLAATETEFRRWIEQNVNHPSIVAWDQENEGHVRLDSLKAELRRYDPSRLWAEDDFEARHLYGYSETISEAPEYPFDGSRPATVLESCRLWLDERGELAVRENFKTSRTVSGWGLYFYRPDEVEQLQADLHADLGSFYRAHRIQAWAPFALLSGAANGQNFFLGNLADSLVPKRNLHVLARLNEPFGASIEMNQAREWYKERKLHAPGRRYSKRIWVWNDTDTLQRAELEVSLCDTTGAVISVRKARVEVEAYGATPVEMRFPMPRKEGVYLLRPELVRPGGSHISGLERRLMVAHHAEPWLGVRAFGGHSRPFAGCRSLLENFSEQELSVEMQQAIIEQSHGELIDRIRPQSDGSVQVRTTRYPSAGHSISTERCFAPHGELLAEKQQETILFTDLPDSIRQYLVQQTGSVPIDESKIRISRDSGITTYTISTIGSSIRHIIRTESNGTMEYRQEKIKSFNK